MGALLHEGQVRIISNITSDNAPEKDTNGIVEYNGRKYTINLNWLRFDPDDRKYYIHLSYLIKERII